MHITISLQLYAQEQAILHLCAFAWIMIASDDKLHTKVWNGWIIYLLGPILYFNEK